VYSEKTKQQEKLPSTLSHKILTNLLKEEMGFKGVVVTDAMNMAGVANTFDQVQAAKLAINAGVDLMCMPCELKSKEDLANLDKIIDGVEKAVNDGEIQESRLDDAVTRILTLKENKGILDWKESNYSLEKALATVGSDENRAKEREIATKAVTVIKNENNTLPLNVTKKSKVLMLCPYTNEQSQMLMGWNRAKQAGLIPDGAEVKVQCYQGHDDLETVKENIDWADTVIINSEIYGTYDTDYKHWRSAGPNNFTKYCKENNKTSVIMSVDLPYDVQLYPYADAILAVYGDAGSSVDPTEAIIGGATTSKAAYGPNIIAGIEVALGTFGATGTLPVNVTKYDADSDSYTDEIVYKRGYGITYDAKVIDRDTLANKVAELEKLEKGNYTDASWSVFEIALKNAQEVLSKVSSQEDLDEALATLNKAYEALTENKKEEPTNPSDKKEEPTTPSDKKDDTVKTDTTTKTDTKKDNNSKVKTGDNA
ncbi:MAG: cell wall anchor protein, partial [Coprobacillus sp.]|nr:cell wall anchor protein [Coprobacillus sp.]